MLVVIVMVVIQRIKRAAQLQQHSTDTTRNSS
jgi:hypothetical protein